MDTILNPIEYFVLHLTLRFDVSIAIEVWNNLFKRTA